MSVNIPVIMCGGSGIRLWPLSRPKLAKPFMDLPQGGSLFDSTISELPFSNVPEVVIITTDNLAPACIDAISKIQVDTNIVIIVEPRSKNTAATIAFASRYVSTKYGDDSVLAILPADHWFKDRKSFNTSVELAADIATNDQLVILGITPHTPATGYGYFEVERTDQKQAPKLKVKRFIEKPDLELAQQLITNDCNYWNSGVYVGAAQTLLKEYEQHMPKLFQNAKKWDVDTSEQKVIHIPDELYADLEAISIDYGVTEKTSRLAAVAVPTEAGWSDVGTWEQFKELLLAQDNQNRSAGKVDFVNSNNTNVVANSERKVVVAGCEDITVIDTPDALLVTSNDNQTDIRELVEKKLAKDTKLQEPYAQKRAWGSYALLAVGPNWKVKRIDVNPGCRLSLQSHKHRSESWMLISGELTVTIDSTEKKLAPGETCFIPLGAKHRMSNYGKTPALVIETQYGEQLREDDIIRYEDDFGRSDL